MVNSNRIPPQKKPLQHFFFIFQNNTIFPFPLSSAVPPLSFPPLSSRLSTPTRTTHIHTLQTHPPPLYILTPTLPKYSSHRPTHSHLQPYSPLPINHEQPHQETISDEGISVLPPVLKTWCFSSTSGLPNQRPQNSPPGWLQAQSDLLSSSCRNSFPDRSRWWASFSWPDLRHSLPAKEEDYGCQELFIR